MHTHGLWRAGEILLTIKGFVLYIRIFYPNIKCSSHSFAVQKRILYRTDSLMSPDGGVKILWRQRKLCVSSMNGLHGYINQSIYLRILR
jgi:hypothetical protein